MKQGWEYKRFDEVFNLQMGKTPDRKNPEYFGGKNVWISIRDLGDKDVSESYEHITDIAVSDTNIRKVNKGTVIMSFKLTVGKCGIAAKDLYTNEAIMAFNTKESYDINPSFLYYYLQCYNWKGSNKAVMGITLNKATISKQYINIPPKSTQLAIVSELDKINELIRLKKEQLKDYDNLAQSIFYQMFGDPVENEMGWEVKKWGDLFHTILGKMLDKSKQINNSSQYKYLANINVQWGYFDFSDLRSMSFTDKELTKYELKTNDLLLCEGGEAGRCAIWNETNEIILFQKAIHRARLIDKNSADVLYIRYWMQFYKKNNGLKDYISKSTIEHLTGEKLKKLPIPLPPLPLQQLFAQRIEQIEKQKAEVQKAIADLETLLASRMQYWFE